MISDGVGPCTHVLIRDIPYANLTLHYSLMPYVGYLTSGIAATAEDLYQYLK